MAPASVKSSRLAPSRTATAVGPLEAVLERRALGVKSGEGIPGRYDARAIEALVQRRARALMAMAHLHAED